LDLESIIAELKKERDRIGRAIAALEGAGSSSATTKSVAAVPPSAPNQRQRGRLTPAGRKRLSEAMKKRWAERRKKAS
jgi:hypothetical protein